MLHPDFQDSSSELMSSVLLGREEAWREVELLPKLCCGSSLSSSLNRSGVGSWAEESDLSIRTGSGNERVGRFKLPVIKFTS